MKPGWEEPFGFVCDNVDMAEFFIERAKENRPDLNRRWCLNIAAGAIYSAVRVFDADVADGEAERLALSYKSGTSQVDKLVNMIRHGAVHFKQDQGIGESFGPGKEDHEAFYWMRGPRGKTAQFPIREILEAMTEVAKLVKKHCMDTTGTWYIRMG